MILELETQWPAALPLPAVDYSSTPRNATITTTPESAIITRRSRFTKSYPTLSVAWRFTDEEFFTFETFFQDLGNGAAQFKIELRYPENSALKTWAVRFIGGYQVARDDALRRLVQSSIELIEIVSSATSGLVVNWDALDLTGLENNDPAVYWPDSSGHGVTALQLTEGRQPLYKTNVFGSSPALFFDGWDDTMFFKPVSIPSWTLFIVWETLVWNAFSTALAWTGSGVAGFIFRDAVGNAAAWAPNLIALDGAGSVLTSKYSHGGYLTPYPSSTSKGIHVHRWNHLTGAHAWLKNKQNAGGQPIVSQYTLDGYGSPYPGTYAEIGHGYDYVGCHIAAIRVYNSALPDAEVLEISDELNARFPVY